MRLSPNIAFTRISFKSFWYSEEDSDALREKFTYALLPFSAATRLGVFTEYFFNAPEPLPEPPTKMSSICPWIFGDYPNIKGTATWTRGGGGTDEQGPQITSSGIVNLVKKGSSQSGERIGGGTGDIALSIDAGRLNPLYSDSVSTVRVDALRVLSLIKAF